MSFTVQVSITPSTTIKSAESVKDLLERSSTTSLMNGIYGHTISTDITPTIQDSTSTTNSASLTWEKSVPFVDPGASTSATRKVRYLRVQQTADNDGSADDAGQTYLEIGLIQAVFNVNGVKTDVAQALSIDHSLQDSSTGAAPTGHGVQYSSIESGYENQSDSGRLSNLFDGSYDTGLLLSGSESNSWITIDLGLDANGNEWEMSDMYYVMISKTDNSKPGRGYADYYISVNEIGPMTDALSYTPTNIIDFVRISSENFENHVLFKGPMWDDSYLADPLFQPGAVNGVELPGVYGESLDWATATSTYSQMTHTVNKMSDNNVSVTSIFAPSHYTGFAWSFYFNMLASPAVHIRFLGSNRTIVAIYGNEFQILFRTSTDAAMTNFKETYIQTNTSNLGLTSYNQWYHVFVTVDNPPSSALDSSNKPTNWDAFVSIYINGVKKTDPANPIMARRFSWLNQIQFDGVNDIFAAAPPHVNFAFGNCMLAQVRGYNSIPAIESEWLSGTPDLSAPNDVPLPATVLQNPASGTGVSEKTLPQNPITATSNVNANVTGNYTITYASNTALSDGNMATRYVYVRDFMAPIITASSPELGVSTPHSLVVGSSWSDPGATALDWNYVSENGSTLRVHTIGYVDTTTLGTYELKYNASDEGGNTADEVVRTVIIVDGVAPVLSLTGDANVSILYDGTSYSDPGATATDQRTTGGSSVSLSSDQVTVGYTWTVTKTKTLDGVDTPHAGYIVDPGDYKILYTLNDGTNSVSQTRNVTIQPLSYTTHNSWTIAMSGPDATDALSEKLGVLDVETYVATLYQQPHVSFTQSDWASHSTKFDAYDGSNTTVNVGGNILHRKNRYTLSSNVAFVGKHSSSNTQALNYSPEDSSALSDDLYVHAPSLSTEGTVVKVKLLNTANYVLHDTWLRPLADGDIGLSIYKGNTLSSSLVADRYVFNAYDIQSGGSLDYNTFVSGIPTAAPSYTNGRSSALSLGLLQKNSFLYFVVDNAGSHSNDEANLRFRLSFLDSSVVAGTTISDETSSLKVKQTFDTGASEIAPGGSSVSVPAYSDDSVVGDRSADLLNEGSTVNNVISLTNLNLTSSAEGYTFCFWKKVDALIDSSSTHSWFQIQAATASDYPVAPVSSDTFRYLRVESWEPFHHTDNVTSQHLQIMGIHVYVNVAGSKTDIAANLPNSALTVEHFYDESYDGYSLLSNVIGTASTNRTNHAPNLTIGQSIDGIFQGAFTIDLGQHYNWSDLYYVIFTRQPYTNSASRLSADYYLSATAPVSTQLGTVQWNDYLVKQRVPAQESHDGPYASVVFPGELNDSNHGATNPLVWAWAQPEETPSLEGIFAKYYQDGRFQYQAAIDATPPSVGNWVHYALTYEVKQRTPVLNGEHSLLTVFQNGSLDASGPLGSVGGSLRVREEDSIAVPQIDKILLGNTEGTEKPLNGKIDDLRVYDRVLTQSEILSLYEMDTRTTLTKSPETLFLYDFSTQANQVSYAEDNPYPPPSVYVGTWITGSLYNYLGHATLDATLVDQGSNNNHMYLTRTPESSYARGTYNESTIFHLQSGDGGYLQFESPQWITAAHFQAVPSALTLDAWPGAFPNVAMKAFALGMWIRPGRLPNGKLASPDPKYDWGVTRDGNPVWMQVRGNNGLIGSSSSLDGGNVFQFRSMRVLRYTHNSANDHVRSVDDVFDFCIQKNVDFDTFATTSFTAPWDTNGFRQWSAMYSDTQTVYDHIMATTTASSRYDDWWCIQVKIDALGTLQTSLNGRDFVTSAIKPNSVFAPAVDTFIKAENTGTFWDGEGFTNISVDLVANGNHGGVCQIGAVFLWNGDYDNTKAKEFYDTYATNYGRSSNYP